MADSTAQKTDRATERRNERRAVAKFRRSFGSAEVNYLNITAMMDMMTILLVFMLINFSASATSINLSDTLALPSSKTSVKPEDSTAITVTKTVILVEDDAVVPVVRGTIDPSNKRDGDSGFLITPLFAHLDKQSKRMKALAAASDRPFKGEATIIADKSTPYRLLNEVLYTAGEAQFRRFRLVVLEKKK